MVSAKDNTNTVVFSLLNGVCPVGHDQYQVFAVSVVCQTGLKVICAKELITCPEGLGTLLLYSVTKVKHTPEMDGNLGEDLYHQESRTIPHITK